MMNHTNRLSRVLPAALCLSLGAVAGCEKKQEPAPQPGAQPPSTASASASAPSSTPPTGQAAPPPAPTAPSGPSQDAGGPFRIITRERTEPKPSDAVMNVRHGYAKGIRYAVPRTWEAEPPSNSMRLAQFRLPAPKDSGLANGMAVISGGIGGSVDENLLRWVAQIKDPKSKPTKQELIVGDLMVTEIRATGTYDAGMAMPGAPATPPQPDTTMFGAIIDNGPEGLVFIKATGPEAVMTANKGAWDLLIRSVFVVPDPNSKSPKP